MHTQFILVLKQNKNILFRDQQFNEFKNKKLQLTRISIFINC